MSSLYINVFEDNICSAESLEPIYLFIANKAENMDATYLLRAEYVLIVSALDTYVHMVIEDRLVDNLFDICTDQGEFCVPISMVKRILSLQNELMQNEVMRDERKRDLCRYYIRERLRKDSYQSPKSLEYAFGLIGIRRIWSSVKTGMGMESDSVKNKLGLIVNRRNMIVHESDRNRVTGEIQQIDLQTVLDCKSFIVRLVNELEVLVSGGELAAEVLTE